MKAYVLHADDFEILPYYRVTLLVSISSRRSHAPELLSVALEHDPGGPSQL